MFKCIFKHRKVFSKKNQQVLPMTLYHMNTIDYNNNNMGSVDFVGQLSNVCRYDYQWHRNREC